MSVIDSTCPEASRVFGWTRSSARKRSRRLCVVLQYRSSLRSYRASSVRGRSTRAGYLVETRLIVESAGHCLSTICKKSRGKRSLCASTVRVQGASATADIKGIESLRDMNPGMWKVNPHAVIALVKRSGVMIDRSALTPFWDFSVRSLVSRSVWYHEVSLSAGVFFFSWWYKYLWFSVKPRSVILHAHLFSCYVFLLMQSGRSLFIHHFSW